MKDYEVTVTKRNADTSTAASYLGIPESTLVYWRKERLGPRWYKIGRRVLYDFVDLDAFMDASKAAS